MAGQAGAGEVPGFPPSFFIVGAPRCGTTSLSKALRDRPEVCFARPKEANFFLLPFDGSPEEERARYLSLFHRGLSPAHRALGDGSVMYLYRPETLERALRFDPRARFIVNVRSPLDMLPSYHARMLYLLDENEPDFEAAWRLQERRRRGQAVPRSCREARLLDYGEVGSLGRHVERLFELVGRERCHVVVYDDLAGRTAQVLGDVLGFLGLPAEGHMGVARKRQNFGFRSRALQYFAAGRLPGQARLPELSPALAGAVGRLRRRVKRFNTVPIERDPLSTGFRAELCAYFTDDVRRLSALLERDLTHWIGPKAPPPRAAPATPSRAPVQVSRSK